jgi:LPXTG-motif cell wall-anchored protein
MFSVRRLSPRVLTVLTAAGLGLVGLVATAAPASAHTTSGSRDCSTVTVNFTQFAKSSIEDLNEVHVVIKDARGQVVLDKMVNFQEASTTRTFDNMPATGRLFVFTAWDHTGADNQSGAKNFTLDPMKDCKPPCQERGFFTYTFDGPAGDATVTLLGKNPLCTPITVLLASFKTEGPTFETSGHQTVFDQVSQVIDQPKTYTLHVKVPNCFTQVDLYVTDQKAVDFDAPNDPLGQFLAENTRGFIQVVDGKPVKHGTSHFNGGTVGCTVETTPPPTTPPPTTVAPTSTAPAAPAPPGTSLPNTGASPFPKVVLAIVLLGAGTGLVYLGRRRRRSVA